MYVVDAELVRQLGLVERDLTAVLVGSPDSMQWHEEGRSLTPITIAAVQNLGSRAPASVSRGNQRRAREHGCEAFR